MIISENLKEAAKFPITTAIVLQKASLKLQVSYLNIAPPGWPNKKLLLFEFPVNSKTTVICSQRKFMQPRQIEAFILILTPSL